jgi:hypothetical protein
MRTHRHHYFRPVSIGTLALLLFAAAICAQTTPRKVRLSFLPPPLEGTISLGVYDTTGNIVRVLHRQAKLDDFTAGADALTTTWDGRNDDGKDLPPGKYTAHGFVVAPMKIEWVGSVTQTAPAPATVPVRLVANPLITHGKPTAEVTAGFDEDSSFLQTGDGLPLFTVDEDALYLFSASVSQRADKSLDFFQEDGDTVDQFHITGIDKMMAFDCGDFELK